MDIVFMGTPDFSVPILKGLIENDYTVSAVVTQPDRPKGRKKKLTPPPVKVEAERHGLEVLQPETLKKEEQIQAIIEKNPDLIVTAAYGQILPEELLKAPKLGSINVHASLLPKYRGGAPIHQAIIDGEEKTGVTIMYMVKELDAGDMLAQKEVEITYTDTVGSLHDKLSIVGRELLLETIPQLQAGTLQPTPQNEAEATFAPNIQRGQEEINWERTALDIYNQVRGMNPWPVAYTTYKEHSFKIWSVGVDSHTRTDKFSPGTIVEISANRLLVAAGEGTAITVEELQPAGKKKMPIADFLNGKHELDVGERLGQ
ncbi:methionyl-tRNA formyltransferase [Alteribacillus iranensis]|uniref:Methionyl-tRNA formyltransferase n=1 Tax=Alteribacillus iranensis TaxID=930128 RepID=A0A1I2ABD1_9BACI|nr:methionyl-tRNA formyltransferase [Alteribacillus iranensis]SFE40120.1 methionyl-tRNA formyltransferase [Alteribacillus iranensis]